MNMKNTLKKLLLISSTSASLFLNACATQTPGKVPTQATRLNSNQIENVIQRAISEKLAFDDAFDGGLTYIPLIAGRLETKSRFISKMVPGAWRVDSGTSTLCIRIENAAENCYQFYALTTDTFYIDVPGLSLEANTLSLKRQR
jgi:hypothetical protein